MTIHESAEDYLESILILSKEKGFARSVDVAMRLNVTKPSVSFAMKRLRENGYIEMDSESLLTLTPKGYKIADRIYERHTVLTRGLMMLGVSEEQARTDACRIEHDISDETFAAIKSHLTNTPAAHE